jgi:hypothetical protein
MIPDRYQDYYGDQTRWFIGRVVNINDPKELGRIKVRIYGVHTSGESEIKDEDLPWAQVVAPITEGGVKGLGGILGIKVDAQAFGIFLDGKNSQLPLVLGSIPKYEDYALGGKTTNLLATDFAEDHPSYKDRVEGRLDGDDEVVIYGTAVAPKLDTINEKSEAYYGDADWSEPEPAGGVPSIYPWNQVKQTASGHIEEFDDTPGSRRYHRYHPAGSFEEINDDGSRTIKIMGKDYEMYLDGKNIFVSGNLNLTVSGNKRELIQGNYHLEVEGDMTMNLHQSLQTKIEMNSETEIGGYRVHNIREDDNLTILNGSRIFNVMTGNRQETVKGNDTKTVEGNILNTNYGTFNTVSVGNVGLAVSNGTLTQTASGVITVESKSNMVTSIDGSITETAGTTITSTATSGDYTLFGGPDIQLNP